MLYLSNLETIHCMYLESNVHPISEQCCCICDRYIVFTRFIQKLVNVEVNVDAACVAMEEMSLKAYI